MTRARTAAEESAAADERNRAAWNLPRRQLAPTTPSPSARMQAESGAAGPGADAAVERDLDWNGFRLRSFPASRRHHLPAVAAYAAYRSSRVVGAAAVRVAQTTVTPPASAATDSWEDEGGAGLREPSEGGAR